MKVLILDASVLTYKAWHTMHSANYEAESDNELVEFVRNSAKEIIFQLTLHRADKVFFATDCPPGTTWREDILPEYYLSRLHARMFRILPEGGDPQFYAAVDDKVWRLTYLPDEGRVVSKKLRKAELPDPMSEVPGFGPNSGEYDVVFDSLLPAYKKSRAVGAWNYETPKVEFKKHATVVCRNLAALTQCYQIQAPNAEADDLSYAVCRHHRADEVVFVTTDSDWSQLMIRHPNARWYDPVKHGFVDITPAAVQRNMWVKVIGGDASDSIPGICLNNRITVGETKAGKIVDEVGVDGTYEWLKANAYLPSLERNLRLISLKLADPLIRAGCLEAVKSPGRIPAGRLSWKDFGVTEACLTRVKTDAEKQRIELSR